MHFDLVCACGAGLQIMSQGEDQSTAVWLMVHRFANAHAKCGYVTNATPEENGKATKNIKIIETND